MHRVDNHPQGVEVGEVVSHQDALEYALLLVEDLGLVLFDWSQISDKLVAELGGHHLREAFGSLLDDHIVDGLVHYQSALPTEMVVPPENDGQHSEVHQLLGHFLGYFAAMVSLEGGEVGEHYHLNPSVVL